MAMTDNAQKVYKFMLTRMNPRIPKAESEMIEHLNTFTGVDYSNYLGGIGDKRRTLHENLFHYMNPNFQQQVPFGTGKDGRKKYGTNKYTVDFYDPDKNVAVEIDGPYHRKDIFIRKRDKLKDQALYEVHGIKVVRIVHELIEICFEWFITLCDLGGLFKEMDETEKIVTPINNKNLMFDEIDPYRGNKIDTIMRVVVASTKQTRSVIP